MSKVAQEKIPCAHCGDTCGPDPVRVGDKPFCCDGCKMVYELLEENNLCTYYTLDAHPGVSPKILQFEGRFAYLDDAATVAKLLKYEDAAEAHVVLHLPQIHCSSCVWLLEHLYRLDPGILRSRTDFLRKEIAIEYSKSATTLRRVVELLATIGYEPRLNLQDLGTPKKVNPQRRRIYRIAVAGFCFSNIMLLSFPEYFHLGSSPDASMARFFGYLNLALAMPAFLYSGGEFFVSAWQGLRARFLNIDIPLALSILITFGRSVYEILTETGAGYLDSMTGIIFFMLIGRYFQEKTYFNLHFDRNFRSYFPIAVSVVDGAHEHTTSLSDLKPGQRIRIRSQEIVPADARLLSGTALIDYSFVTGESHPVRVEKGGIVYAGGRQTGAAIELEVLREVEQSYLTSLWNKESFQEEKDRESRSFIHRLSRNFSVFLIALSVGAWLWWLPSDPSRGMNALTTVLIVACPCALLLSATFTNGSVLRILSRNGFYLRNALVIESLSRITHVVFDKTGTITQGDRSEIRFEGGEPSEHLFRLVRAAASQSNHPRSRALTRELAFTDLLRPESFSETAGKGIEAVVEGHRVRLGSGSFVLGPDAQGIQESHVHVSIDGKPAGYFTFSHAYRNGLPELLDRLRRRFRLSLLSGDNDRERGALEAHFGSSDMAFFQSPSDKMQRLEDLRRQGHSVMMVGDGLNDAGALRSATVGVSVSDDVNNFSPSCDAILEGRSFDRLDALVEFARRSRGIIYASFGISLLYNVIGLGFAVQGTLQPVVAAILMPASSLTIVLFTTGASYLVSRRMGL